MGYVAAEDNSYIFIDGATQIMPLVENKFDIFK